MALTDRDPNLVGGNVMLTMYMHLYTLSSLVRLILLLYSIHVHGDLLKMLRE